jgi:hypothetical protein
MFEDNMRLCLIIINQAAMNKTKPLIGSLVILLIVSIGASFMFYQKAQKSAGSQSCEVKTKPANAVAYTTFSSPKLDFTFEYPSTWTYQDVSYMSDSGIVNFAFKNTPGTEGPPVLAVYSPRGTELSDFCSGKMGGNTIYPYMQLNVFPTNDSQTFITYEQCGEKQDLSDAIIYWQKGEKFLSADEIKGSNKISGMLFNLNSGSQEDRSIGLHIAQSIKMK